MGDTISAVVVTYNRKNLLLECLEALRKQTRPVDAIYLIDNASTDGTPELLMEKGYISELPPQELKEPWEREFEIINFVDGKPIKLHYVRMHENTGSSGGFHEGMKRAYEKGYDWFWLMDDDGKPEIDCLENLIPKSEKVISGPIVFNNEGKSIWDYSAFFGPLKWYMKIYDLFNVPYKTIPFNGFLISRKVIDNIGFPNPNFFIQCDDVEYSWRASKNGFDLKICKSAKFFHPKPISENLVESISDKTLYYYVRNNIIVARSYDFFLIRTIKRFIDMIILYFKIKSKEKKRIIFKAMIDGLIIRNFGKNNK